MSRLCPSGLREMKWRQPDVNQLQTIKDPVSYGPRDWDSNIACRTVLTPLASVWQPVGFKLRPGRRFCCETN